jgi:methyltransferase-like protein
MVISSEIAKKYLPKKYNDILDLEIYYDFKRDIFNITVLCSKDSKTPHKIPENVKKYLYNYFNFEILNTYVTTNKEMFKLIKKDRLNFNGDTFFLSGVAHLNYMIRSRI